MSRACGAARSRAEADRGVRLTRRTGGGLLGRPMQHRWAAPRGGARQFKLAVAVH